MENQPTETELTLELKILLILILMLAIGAFTYHIVSTPDKEYKVKVLYESGINISSFECDSVVNNLVYKDGRTIPLQPGYRIVFN